MRNRIVPLGDRIARFLPARWRLSFRGWSRRRFGRIEPELADLALVAGRGRTAGSGLTGQLPLRTRSGRERAMTAPRITPVVLTWNEAANIERTLSRLGWAEKVLVVDSGSDDGTQELAMRFANVVLVERAFDNHSAQWEFGIRHQEVATEWILALDADYVLGEELVAEIRRLDPASGPRGYRARFRYCIEGEPLRASIYPPVVVLFDRRSARYEQVGHTQRLGVEGEIGLLSGRIDHDDRKPFARFAEAQRRYAALEAARLVATPWRALSWSGRVRRLRFVAPLAVPLWLLVGRGLVLDGSRGFAYARQRWLAEATIARALRAEARRGPRS